MEELLLKKISARMDQNQKASLVLLTEINGSTPRKEGSMMAVFSDSTIEGSIGGGKIEYLVIQQALDCMRNNRDTAFEYTLTEDALGMQCGGQVKGFIKTFSPKPRLIIIGAGHIGEKLHQLALILGMSTLIVDDRSEFANADRFPHASDIRVGDIGTVLSEISIQETDAIVIVTKGHASDLVALEHVLQGQCAYIGMIGSANKVRFNMNECLKKGFSETQLQSVYAPIGLNLGGCLPEEIAFSIMSEIIMVKNKGTLDHMRDIKKVKI